MDADKPYSYMVASNPNSVHMLDNQLFVLFSGESQTKPAHCLGPKVYDFYLMHIVISGKGAFSLNGKCYNLQAGDVFLIEPEQLIRYESDLLEPWCYRWVAFQGKAADKLVRKAGFAEQTPIQTLRRPNKAYALFKQLYFALRCVEHIAELKSTGLLQLLLAYFSEQNNFGVQIGQGSKATKDEQLQQQIIHYLSSQYTEPVSIEQMAEAIGYNRAYLSRIFKKQTGVSPISFLLQFRLDKAKLLLREKQDLTIEQISASVGIQDALYFSKQFRKAFGLSPTAYRSQNWT